MNKKIVSVSVLTILLVGMLTLAFNIKELRASGTIYIRADGSVEGTDKIQRDGSIYTFIDDIYDEIVVERNDTVIDGAFHKLQGSGTGNGIVLGGRSNITLRNLQISAFTTGVLLLSSSRCVISRNNITANKDYGIVAGSQSSSAVGSSNSIFSENNITNNGFGIYFNVDYGWSDNNTVTKNQVSNNINAGIFFDGSYSWSGGSYNVVSANILTNNTLGIHMWGGGNTIYGNRIEALEDGLNLVAMGVSAISENTITTANGNGINLLTDFAYHGYCPSDNTNISRNTIAVANGTGMAISGCSNNTVSGNKITVTNGNCIYLYPYRTYYYEDIPSQYNLISENNLTAINQNSIQILNSSGNSIYHNNFLSLNAGQVWSENSANQWDNGYPSGGNYWSDYNGTDLYSGPSQNETGRDGVGDVPYVIDSSNSDNYPLMEPLGETWIVDDDGLSDFGTIQEAINAASDGDAIFVRNGTYYENVIVNRTVTLVGEDSFATIIEGEEAIGTGIHVTANDVSIRGFMIQEIKYGICLNGSSDCIVAENQIRPYEEGILLSNSSERNSIYENTINHQAEGAFAISLHDSDNNTISRNIGGWNGISLLNSSNNTIFGQNIGGYCSLSLTASSDNIITENKMDSPHSIILSDSHNNIISRNEIHGPVQLWNSSGNNLHENVIEIWSSIYLTYSSSNKFYHNNLISSSVYIETPGYANVWDAGYPSGGNYWSDNDALDDFWGENQDLEGSDMIRDAAYKIDEDNQDRYPLMEPYPMSNFWTFEEYPVAVISDSVITDFSFQQKTGEMNFNVTADTADSCKVIISKWMLDGAFNLLVDDIPATWSVSWSNECHMIDFTYSQGTHSVRIVGESMLRFDLNGDGKINILDIALVAKCFGEELAQ